jgi:hypothetical protein
MLAELQRTVEDLRDLVKQKQSSVPLVESLDVTPSASAEIRVDVSAEFSVFLQRLRDTAFSSERSTLLQEAAREGGMFASGITSQQLGEIVRVSSFV